MTRHSPARDTQFVWRTQKYVGAGKDVLLIGAAFDPATRNLERWLVARPEA